MTTDAVEKLKDLHDMFSRLWTRRWHLYIEKWNCRRIAELGVFNGRNFMRMISSGPEVAIAVDIWRDDGVASRNDTGVPQPVRDKQYERFLAMVADKPFVKVYRDYTFSVAPQVPDGYLDLIYIDADHSYEGCLRDLRDWWPKMKSGAAFTGDDYRREEFAKVGVRFEVIEALATFCKEVGVEVTPLPRHGWGMIKP